MADDHAGLVERLGSAAIYGACDGYWSEEGTPFLDLYKEAADAIASLTAQLAAAEARAQAAEGAWRPIETAPQKSGSRILGVVEDKVRVIAWGKTSHVPLYGWCLADQGPEDFDLCEPSIWRPLPAPPIQGEG